MRFSITWASAGTTCPAIVVTMSATGPSTRSRTCTPTPPTPLRARPITTRCMTAESQTTPRGPIPVTLILLTLPTLPVAAITSTSTEGTTTTPRPGMAVAAATDGGRGSEIVGPGAVRSGPRPSLYGRGQGKEEPIMSGQRSGRGSSCLVDILPDETEIRSFLASGEAETYSKIRRACDHYLRFRFGQGLTADDRDDIVQAAIADLFSLARSSASALDVELRRALERHRKRAKRRNIRIVSSPPSSPLIDRASAAHSDELVARTHLLDVVREIEASLESSLVELSDRDRALVISEYRLSKPSLATATPPTFPTESARNKAIWRARRRLNRNLEAHLSAQLAHSKTKTALLEDALRIVRGDSVGSALDVGATTGTAGDL